MPWTFSQRAMCLDTPEPPGYVPGMPVQRPVQSRIPLLAGLLERRVDVVSEQGLRNPFRRREILGTRQVVYAA
jgi:hypothetical protein